MTKIPTMQPSILALLAPLLLLTGCGLSTTVQSNAAGAAVRTITDGTGRQVSIPEVVEDIVPLGNTPRMICYLGLADRVVGIEECEIAESPIQAYAYPHRETWSKLPVCGTNAMGETAYYPEEIILANPDVILCTAPADTADHLQTETGIPVVALQDAPLFSEEYDTNFRIIGEVCSVSERAELVVNYIDACLEDLSRRTAAFPDTNKPSVLAAGATFKGSHSIDGIYTNYPVFQVLHANDVAQGTLGQDGASGIMVDREQILAWDPDMIFFDAGSMAVINADYQDNPDYFNQLTAVQNGQLYQWPNSTWHWSNVEIPLVSAYYTGALLYPEAFDDIDFDAKASEIFDFFLGEPDYLETLDAAGAGYKAVTLGG